MEALKIKDKTMETVKDNNLNELNEKFNMIIDDIKDKVKNSTYQDSNNIHKRIYNIKNVENLQYVDIDNSTETKKIKRFKRYLNRFILKRSVNSLNRLFFVVYKTILKIDKYPRIVCTKHSDIQKLRKNWVELQKEADIALSKYKEEKGDFYKKNPQYHKI
jgi:hypothetical protein